MSTERTNVSMFEDDRRWLTSHGIKYAEAMRLAVKVLKSTQSNSCSKLEERQKEIISQIGNLNDELFVIQDKLKQFKEKELQDLELKQRIIKILESQNNGTYCSICNGSKDLTEPEDYPGYWFCQNCRESGKVPKFVKSITRQCVLCQFEIKPISSSVKDSRTGLIFCKKCHRSGEASDFVKSLLEKGIIKQNAK